MVKKAGKSGEYRSFTVEGSSIGFEGGVLVSKTPGSAALKVSRKLFRMVAKEPSYSRFKSDSFVQFIIRETTQGSSHKILAYEGHKMKLSPPVERKLPNGETYMIEFQYKAKALKEHQVHDSLKPKLGGAM